MAHVPVLIVMLSASASTVSALDVRANTRPSATQLATVANKTQVASTAGKPLPGVTTVMKAAQKTYEVVTQDHKNLQAQVAEQQKAAKQLLALHKGQYESTILRQVKDNNDEWSKNQKLRSELKASHERVAQLRQQILAVNNSNNIMRDALGYLLPKVELANDFLGQIGTEVEALDRSEMEAIRPTTPEPTLAYYLGKERTQFGLAPTFLQVGSVQGAFKEVEVAKMSENKELPAAMLETLSRLANANQHAEDMLLSRFKEVLGEKAERHMRLVNDTERLNGTLVASDSTEASLTKAKGHLDRMNSNLRSRLQGLNVFYKQISAAMNRTLEEAEAASSTVHA